MSNQGFGLGQITALILLLIPILTLCDTIAEQFGKDIAIYWHCLWSWFHRASGQQASRENLEMGPISAQRNRAETAQKFSKIQAFRVSIIILSLLSFISFILVAVITAVPWYTSAWNLGATVPFATLFVWAFLFEACHVFLYLFVKYWRLDSCSIQFLEVFGRYCLSFIDYATKMEGAPSPGTDFA
jgi:hypothetical protein